MKKQLKVSYDLEISYTCLGKDEIKEIHNIDPSMAIIELEEVKAINYDEIVLVTVIEDSDGKIIKRCCRIA